MNLTYYYFPRGVYLLDMLYLSSMDDVEFVLIDSIESNSDVRYWACVVGRNYIVTYWHNGSIACFVGGADHNTTTLIDVTMKGTCSC